MAAKALFKDVASLLDLEPLKRDRMEEFFHDIDLDGDETIVCDKLEANLKGVHEQIATVAQEHHLHLSSRPSTQRRRPVDLGKGVHRDPEHDGLHALLCTVMPNCSQSMDKEECLKHVSSWNVPSQSMVSTENEDEEDMRMSSVWPGIERCARIGLLRDQGFCLLPMSCYNL
ncbi:Hypothetical predicted protein [Lecanosticta acicola]|uniref:EF-hand domain-containing protein n=1 Tax=Lecanosticta acicola TaxID=111012 RepID=A0AAI8W0D6_9PEZI|nr:Hypothetical predicted protein [Lecanosticta acicola]